ncbi:DivIVA domain-containing protein [Caldisalinibacter kiritimatiensis]|uniref:Cell division initiation protein DivIVA n=1 Tax=Caldisalinibacter kiritimatiensis TaxID=1304284 RepID=R1CG47_9FIRM|nr:DivIVA domain-containing protein [Caldisalinibacter kiritimatiensis]EOD01290.1 Cell division initiation protein DivIVA [Caldisalinibacter kiritimatiensis]
MITPLDIQNREFRKGVRGYKESEVDSFLDEVMIDYEKLYKENSELKDKITMLNEQLEQYDKMEETLQNTLVVAQSTAEEVKANARKEAELIIKEAEEKARQIINEAHKEVENIQVKYENLKADMEVFRTRFKTLLESQLQTLDNYYKNKE